MHVFISDDARVDLKGIWNFLAESSVESADKVVDELVDRALACGDYSLTGAPLEQLGFAA